jgi:hypothetical protein
MPSRREQVLQAVVTALGAVGKPTGLTVHRFRTRPIEHDELPAIVVYAIGESVKTAPGQVPRQGMADRTLRVRLECRVAVSDGTSPDAALDDLVAWGSEALMTDRRQGGLALRTDELESQWDAAEGERTLAAAAVDYAIQYLTTAADQSAAP